MATDSIMLRLDPGEYLTLVQALRLAQAVYSGVDTPDMRKWKPAERAASAADVVMVREKIERQFPAPGGRRA